MDTEFSQNYYIYIASLLAFPIQLCSKAHYATFLISDHILLYNVTGTPLTLGWVVAFK